MPSGVSLAGARLGRRLRRGPSSWPREGPVVHPTAGAEPRARLLRYTRAALSFWDHIKPSTLPPAAAHLEVTDEGRVLRLTWEDGLRTAVSARTLRQGCPCAACVDEWTHQRTVDPANVSPDITLLEVRP